MKDSFRQTKPLQIFQMLSSTNFTWSFLLCPVYCVMLAIHYMKIVQILKKYGPQKTLDSDSFHTAQLPLNKRVIFLLNTTIVVSILVRVSTLISATVSRILIKYKVVSCLFQLVNVACCFLELVTLDLFSYIIKVRNGHQQINICDISNIWGHSYKYLEARKIGSHQRSHRKFKIYYNFSI